MTTPFSDPVRLQGFFPPDGTAPIDINAYIREIPPEAVTKGMFFDPLREQVREAGHPIPGRDRYIAFRNYPMPEYLEVVLGCGELLHPGTPTRALLRMAGRLVYPTFASSLLGSLLFKFAGRDVPRLLKAVPRAYNQINPRASAEVETRGQNSAIVKVRGLWDVPEVSQVGIFEGGIEALGLEGEVLVRPLTECDCDLLLNWR